MAVSRQAFNLQAVSSSADYEAQNRHPVFFSQARGLNLTADGANLLFLPSQWQKKKATSVFLRAITAAGDGRRGDRLKGAAVAHEAILGNTAQSVS